MRRKSRVLRDAREHARFHPHREHLRGIVLFCGVYDAEKVDREGPFGWFIETALWSHFGANNISTDDALRAAGQHRRFDALTAFLAAHVN